MFKKTVLMSGLALLWICSGHGHALPADPGMKQLKALAGNWALQDGSGAQSGLRATYQVAAGGAAVIETLLAGTVEETVTLYHLENKEVTVTQLSSRGVPERFTTQRTRDRDQLRFARQAGADEIDRVRAIQLTLMDEEQVRIEWFTAGREESAPSQVFELRRSAPLEELAAEAGRLRVDLESLQRELDRRLKREILIREKDQPDRTRLETRTLPPGPGWNVSGVPFRQFLHEQTVRFASTYASEGDKGMTAAHFGFKAGPGCMLRFSVLGGHGFVAVVEDEKVPPRRISDIADFSVKLEGGHYGPVIEIIKGGHWSDHPRSMEWDLSRFEGKALRLYVVDGVTNHYGQIAVSEISILEDGAE